VRHPCGITLYDLVIALAYFRLKVVLCSAVKLNARRQVSGIMRGFDQFMNIVLDKAVDDKDGSELGMVVSSYACSLARIAHAHPAPKHAHALMWQTDAPIVTGHPGK
jgi:small nuclear ribonucleoprotein (snRNP)-like protein